MRRWKDMQFLILAMKQFIYPTYGTRDLIIEKYNTVVEKKMLQAFIAAQNPNYVNYESLVDVMQVSELESLDVLNNMTYEELVAFDYETTGNTTL